MNNDKEEMLSEYDLAGKRGIRGKYAASYREGHSVRILDGELVSCEEYFASIEPDVREYFPDSTAVNEALRTLIALVDKRSASHKQ